ncbi:hypothetical protein FAM18124_02105 [Lacticaseibacillus paracasei]|uniref:hypothetical protein n=1 Tax=Lacticaseibacillus paracasei TaxID=1597 RepID=UPI000F43CA4C|nr:hypothetical protein [Lacticaseibacillus paracasei]RND62128.1 hypothetical protein FAM18124_02105 [Lacticaseibacillus paracasei]RND68736.1 hypothetical protein FAM18129_02186 [Lacticaseibacillus paracasei]
MSNETKRDVLVDAVDALADAQASGGNIGHQDANLFMAEYAAALPDDLPVIPEAISDAIKFYWTTYGSEKGLTDLLFDLVEPWRIGVEKVVYAIHEDIRKYYLLHSDVIARAWVLGVWRVEETGEIVKLEEEK